MPALHQARRLVVMLPGRGDDLGAFERSGIAAAIQGVWPDADVLLTDLTLAYYADGGAARRLHDDVVIPARSRGYREIWGSGAYHALATAPDLAHDPDPARRTA